MWELLARPRTIADLTDAICESSGADADSVELGLASVLADLEGRGAVRREDS